MSDLKNLNVNILRKGCNFGTLTDQTNADIKDKIWQDGKVEVVIDTEYTDMVDFIDDYTDEVLEHIDDDKIAEYLESNGYSLSGTVLHE